MKKLGLPIKLAILIGLPIIAIAIPANIPGQEARFAYVLAVMCGFWVSEALPFAVTGLIPIIAFPLLGVLSTRDVCMTYLKDTNMLFLGGLMVAVSIEHCNLHTRIAVKTLLMIGQTPLRLLLSFMLIQAFLSMWISNTAATAMMVPIAEAILKLYDSSDTQCNQKILRDVLFLSISYASNLGGTATLTGTNPNLVLMGFLETRYPKGTDLSYATWLFYNFPGMLLCLSVAYMGLSLYLWIQMGFKTNKKSSTNNIKEYLSNSYQELGPLSFHEKTVITLFSILVLLWVTQAPKMVPGWGEALQDYYGEGFQIHAATPVMLIVVLMFMVPAKNPFKMNSNEAKYKYEPCLTWKVVHEKVPWSVILLIGSGFALAEAGRVSGFNEWVGIQFSSLGGYRTEIIVLVICLATTMITEIMSNTAATTILVPILNSMALQLHINPLFLLIPVTLCCSYAFMLPVATPPNAIVFDAAGDMAVSTMMKCGFLMNVIATFLSVLVAISYGNVIFNFHTFPAWANQTSLYT